MNFAGALIQWGQATGNTAVRDAGIYIYATQSAAIEQLLVRRRQRRLPRRASGTARSAWCGATAARTPPGSPTCRRRSTASTMLPITGRHLYLGLNPAYNKINYDEIVRNAGGEPRAWQDILWEFLALGIPIAALAKFRANRELRLRRRVSPRPTRSTGSATWRLSGSVDAALTANHPLAAAFVKNGQRTYVAANIASAADHRHLLQRNSGLGPRRQDGHDRRMGVVRRKRQRPTGPGADAESDAQSESTRRRARLPVRHRRPLPHPRRHPHPRRQTVGCSSPAPAGSARRVRPGPSSSRQPTGSTTALRTPREASWPPG